MVDLEDEREQIESITPIGRFIFPVPADQSLPSDSPTLFNRLDKMLAGVDAEMLEG